MKQKKSQVSSTIAMNIPAKCTRVQNKQWNPATNYNYDGFKGSQPPNIGSSPSPPIKSTFGLDGSPGGGSGFLFGGGSVPIVTTPLGGGGGWISLPPIPPATPKLLLFPSKLFRLNTAGFCGIDGFEYLAPLVVLATEEVKAGLPAPPLRVGSEEGS